MTHTIVEMDANATPIRNVETFRDWGLALEELALLNKNNPRRRGGNFFEIVSEPDSGEE